MTPTRSSSFNPLDSSIFFPIASIAPHPAMARRIVRTIVQLICFSVLLVTAIFFLDLRYRLLPPRLHNLLPEHHTGSVITDITFHSCSVLSNCMLDTREGWIRINKDVYLDKAWVKQGYIHIKRKKEEELDKAAGEKIVVDIRVGRLEPPMEDGIKWETRPGGIWIKRQTKVIDDVVTGVDLLFGADAVEVRPSWVMREGSLTSGDYARITLRKGPPAEFKKPVLRLKDHKFKIIQVSDLHLSTGTGRCREAEPPSSVAGCEADPRTLDFIAKILDEEKPDFAVLSGDQINGGTAPDAQSAIFKFAEPFIKRKIPYATILGNHDDEGNLSREEVMELTAVLPYSLSEMGPGLGAVIKDKKGREGREGGVGNYYVEVKTQKGDHSAITIYFLDTHSYSPDETNYSGYDWIKPTQIDWFKKTHASLKDHASGYSFVHLNMAFIHIPLPEYRTSGAPIVGECREPSTAPRFNSGFKDVLVNANVGVVSAGHDHVNEYCMLDQESDKPKMWMCYAGGSGFGGYGGYKGYHRRVRLFEIDSPADRITTWKRVEYGDTDKRIDEQIIVEGGAAVQQQK